MKTAQKIRNAQKTISQMRAEDEKRKLREYIASTPDRVIVSAEARRLAGLK